MLNEWDMLDDLMVTRAQSPGCLLDEDVGSLEKQIRVNLRELITDFDLEDVTSYMVSEWVKLCAIDRGQWRGCMREGVSDDEKSICT